MSSDPESTPPAGARPEPRPVPHDEFPESDHIAAGFGYPDEARVASLKLSADMLDELRRYPGWALTPYTETLFEVERFLSAVLSAVPAMPNFGHPPTEQDVIEDLAPEQDDRVTISQELRTTAAWMRDLASHSISDGDGPPAHPEETIARFEALADDVDREHEAWADAWRRDGNETRGAS